MNLEIESHYNYHLQAVHPLCLWHNSAAAAAVAACGAIWWSLFAIINSNV